MRRFILATAAFGAALVCAQLAHADSEIVIRTERDGQCWPTSHPLALGSDGRIWLTGWCSGTYVSALLPDGSSDVLARRQMSPSQGFGDFAYETWPRSDGSAWILGKSQSPASSCALMRASPGTIEVVRPDTGCTGASVAGDAIVTTRWVAGGGAGRIRTEKFLVDGTRAWSRDSIATGNLPEIARGSDGAVHVAATAYDPTRIVVLSYSSDGIPLPEVEIAAAQLKALETDASGALFAVAAVNDGGSSSHEEVLRIEPGVGILRRAIVPPERGGVESLRVGARGPLVVQAVRGQYGAVTSTSLLALSPDLATRWSRIFDESANWTTVVAEGGYDSRIALVVNSRATPDVPPRFVVLDASGDTVTDVRLAVPAGSIVRSLEWLAGGDVALVAASFSGAETYGYTDEILAARVGADGAVRWTRTEGTLAQQTTVSAIFPGADGRFAVVTGSPKPNPPAQTDDPPPDSLAMRIDVFDASGASTLRRDFPLATGAIQWAMPTADGGAMQLSIDDWFISPKLRIGRVAATASLEWEHVVDDAFRGTADPLANGDIAYTAYRYDSSWTFGSISRAGDLRFESPLSPPIPAAPSSIDANGTNVVAIVGWTGSFSGLSAYCGSFDAAGVPGPVATVAMPFAGGLWVAPGSSIAYATPTYGTTPTHIGRVSCTGAPLWDVNLGVTPAGSIRRIEPDGTGGAWVVDYRVNPTTGRARHFSGAGNQIGTPGTFELPFPPERLVVAPDGRLAMAGYVPGVDSCGTAALAVFAPDGNLAWPWVHARAPNACESWPTALAADGDGWLVGTELRVPGQPAAAQVIRVSGRLFSNGFE